MELIKVKMLIKVISKLTMCKILENFCLQIFHISCLFSIFRIPIILLTNQYNGNKILSQLFNQMVSCTVMLTQPEKIFSPELIP